MFFRFSKKMCIILQHQIIMFGNLTFLNLMNTKNSKMISKRVLAFAFMLFTLLGVTSCSEQETYKIVPQEFKEQGMPGGTEGLKDETSEFKFVRIPSGYIITQIDTAVLPIFFKDAAQKHGQALLTKLLNTYDLQTGDMKLEARKSKEFKEWFAAKKVQAAYTLSYSGTVEGAGYQTAQIGYQLGTTYESKALLSFNFNINPYNPIPPFTYGAHVANIGDVVNVGCYDGIYYNKRIEAFWINTNIFNGFATNVYYQGHSQNFAWSAIVSPPSFVGTKGEGRRLEAIKIWMFLL
jgi:hypothetical protein